MLNPRLFNYLFFNLSTELDKCGDEIVKVQEENWGTPAIILAGFERAGVLVLFTGGTEILKIYIFVG